VLVVALLAPAVARADSDVQQWTELGVSHDLSKEWSLELDQHVRFDQDVSRVAAIMPEPSVSYRPRPWLRLGAVYRLQYTRDGSEELVVRHRFALNGRLRHDLGRVRLEYRLQLQEQLRPGADDFTRHTVRNRLQTVYRGWRPWTPFVAGELHHDLYQPDPIVLDKIWLTAGLAHEWRSTRLEVEVFYRAELPFADETAPTAHILGLGVHKEI